MGGDCLDCPLLHQVDVYCKICCQCFFVIKLQLRGADCELGGAMVWSYAVWTCYWVIPWG